MNVTVSPVNDPPSSLLLANASVAENAANGTVVGVLSATDPDGGSLSFTLLDNVGGRFALNGDNLVVANGALLDFEQSPAHTVTIRVSDSTGLFLDRAFGVALQDMDELNPARSS